MVANKHSKKKAIYKEQHYGTGRRKSASSARVFLRSPGTGKILVNQKPLEEYFKHSSCCMILKQPLKLLELTDQFDFYITVKGGGTSGQAGAIRLGIVRAIIDYERKMHPEHTQEDKQDSFFAQLKRAGWVTRDARRVEPKKMGQPKARKKEAYKKR